MGKEAKKASMIDIERHCYILSVTVRAFRGNYQIKDATITVGGDKFDDELISKPQWKLFDKWNKRLGPYESRVRKVVYESSVTFRDGVYIVPKAKAETMIKKIHAIRDDYLAEVAVLVEEWDSFVETLKAKFEPGVWSTVSAKLPKKDDIPHMYGVDVSLWSSGASEAAAACLDAVPGLAYQARAMDLTTVARKLPRDQAETLKRLVDGILKLEEKAGNESSKLINDGVGEWLGEVRETTERVVRTAINSMLEEPAKEFREALENMDGIISRGGVCRAGTLDAVRRAYDKLNSFSFMMPPEIMEKLQSVDRGLRHADPTAINQQQPSAANLVESLRSIREDLDSEVEQVRKGHGFRRGLLL